jgi:hypothetical protein
MNGSHLVLGTVSHRRSQLYAVVYNSSLNRGQYPVGETDAKNTHNIQEVQNIVVVTHVLAICLGQS